MPPPTELIAEKSSEIASSAVKMRPTTNARLEVSFNSRSVQILKVPTIVNACSILTNTILNYALIYGNFGLPALGIVLAPIPSAILALTISQGAYNSEVIRAALGSIPKGQFEACRALGLNKMQTMRKVIIPQAALVAVPSLGNSFISLLKDTSLVSTITVAEIMMTAKTINATAFEPLLLYVEAGVVYLIFSTVLTQLQGMLEKKLGKHLVDSRA